MRGMNEQGNITPPKNHNNLRPQRKGGVWITWKEVQKNNPKETEQDKINTERQPWKNIYATESFNNRLDQGERTHELECRSLGLTQSEEKGKKKKNEKE